MIALKMSLGILRHSHSAKAIHVAVRARAPSSGTARRRSRPSRASGRPSRSRRRRSACTRRSVEDDEEVRARLRLLQDELARVVVVRRRRVDHLRDLAAVEAAEQRHAFLWRRRTTCASCAANL